MACGSGAPNAPSRIFWPIQNWISMLVIRAGGVSPVRTVVPAYESAPTPYSSVVSAQYVEAASCVANAESAVSFGFPG